MKWLSNKRRLGLLFPQNKSGLFNYKKQQTVAGLGDHHKYDDSTGQVYSESTTAIQTSDDSNWTSQTRLVVGPEYRDEDEAHNFVPTNEIESSIGAYHYHIDGLKNTRIRGLKGPRSLQDSAIECIIQNISDCTLEGIACLPPSLVRRIWHAVSKRCLLSFDTWFIFSTLLREDDGATLSLQRYRQNIEKPLSRLHVYTTPLISTCFTFITSLSITTSFDLPDLVKISKITNLGVLEIINHPTNKFVLPVSDRLLRAWHLAAISDGSFRVLRILRLWNHEELTNKSLAFINNFKSLAVYDVRGCKFDMGAKIDAKSLGWRANIEPNVLGLLEAACVERAMIMRESMGLEIKPVRRPCACQLRDFASTEKMLRSETPAFLTREAAVVPGRPIVEYDRLKRGLDKASKTNRKKSVILTDKRWMLLDTCIHSKSRALETWEFTTYTSFARIGELRNDSDLARAGVHIGDHVTLVGNEFLPPVPIVSLRLGPTPVELQINNSQHKPFYSSIYAEAPDEPTLKYDRSDRHGTPSADTLSFTRIKIPLPPLPTEKKANVVPIQSDDAASISSASPAKRRKVGVMKNKKKDLVDMLNSFR